MESSTWARDRPSTTRSVQSKPYCHALWSVGRGVFSRPAPWAFSLVLPENLTIAVDASYLPSAVTDSKVSLSPDIPSGKRLVSRPLGSFFLLHPPGALSRSRLHLP